MQAPPGAGRVGEQVGPSDLQRGRLTSAWRTESHSERGLEADSLLHARPRVTLRDTIYRKAARGRHVL